MDQGTIQTLFALLRSAICGEKLEESEKGRFVAQQLPELVELANKHDIGHLLALGLKQNDLPCESHTLFTAVYRYERINYEFGELCSTLEEAGIPFMPLKGSVLRKYYPEEWMRTSCDIDILVREEDSEKAAALLVEQCAYVRSGKGSHDISLFAPNHVHLELHYNLVEDGIANESAAVLSAVWETANLCAGYQYWYEMPDKMFYFYHIAHMAKHFENGGCGLRPFIDLWILDKMEGANRSERDTLLQKGKLLTFAQAARKLSEVWFDGREMDFISQQMEDYILRGGVYGSNENRITVQQQKKGGRLKYALSKIFIPYDTIKFHYPILEKYRWLTPIMEIRRWCKLIFCGHVRRTVKELTYNQNVSSDKAEETKQFLSNIGL